MARLLVHGATPYRDVGEVADVFPDGHPIGGLDAMQGIQVDVPGMSVEEARELFVHQVPRDLRDAVEAADAEFRAAVVRAATAADPKRDQASAVIVAAVNGDPEVQEAKATLRLLQQIADPSKLPRRPRVLAASVLPERHVTACAAVFAALDGVAADAKAAAHDAVVAEVERREGRKLSKAERDVPTARRIEDLAGSWEAAKARGADKRTLGKLDEAVDALRKASGDARRQVVSAALAGVTAPEFLTLDAETVRAAAVEVAR